LNAGGDFADGAIAYEGSWLGAETFVSFDKRAVERLKAQRVSARLLSVRRGTPSVRHAITARSS
jgi:hypothetical protein